MDYLVDIPRELGITEEQFVRSWNAVEWCTNMATARFARERNSEGKYSIEAFTVQAILGATGVHLAAAAIYDGVKRLLKEQGVKEELEIHISEHPDGTRVAHVRLVKR